MSLESKARISVEDVERRAKQLIDRLGGPRHPVSSFNVAELTAEERLRFGFPADGSLRPVVKRRRRPGRPRSS